MSSIKISVLGCGWFGLPFAKSLIAKGYQVKGSTTTSTKLAVLKEYEIHPFLIDVSSNLFDDEFFDCDLLFINIPPRKKVDDIYQYPSEVKRVLDKAIAHGVKELVFISSTGIYEDGDFSVDESIIPNPNTAAGQKLSLAEGILTSESSISTTIIRFGGLIGANRNLGKFFAGRTAIPNGLAPINLISLTDAINLCITVIHQNAFGLIYHGVHPNHPIRADFYTSLCEASNMPKPEFSKEKIEWKQVDSINLAKLNFKFEFDNWQRWIAENASLL